MEDLNPTDTQLATQAQYYMLLHFKMSSIHNMKQVCMRLYASKMTGINEFLW